MHFHPIEYIKAHPWAGGIILVIGGIIFLKLTGLIGGSTAASSDGSDGTTPAPTDAEVAANAQIEAAQIAANATSAQYGAQVSIAQIGAGVQENADNLASTDTLAGYNAQTTIYSQEIAAAQQLGLAQTAATTQLSQSAISSIGGISKHSSEGAQQEAIIAAALGQAGGQVAYAPVNAGNSASSIISSIGGLAAGVGSIFSDQNLKENIQYQGTDSRGYGVYTYNYKGSKRTYRGYIAQDVAQKNPDAVTVDKSGYMKINTGAM